MGEADFADEVYPREALSSAQSEVNLYTCMQQFIAVLEKPE
jgi:hypothetical protein